MFFDFCYIDAINFVNLTINLAKRGKDMLIQIMLEPSENLFLHKFLRNQSSGLYSFLKKPFQVKENGNRNTL